MSTTEVNCDLDQIKVDIQSSFIANQHSLDDVKHYVLKWYFERDGRLPEPYLFKRVSGSLYFYLRQTYSKNKIKTIPENE